MSQAIWTLMHAIAATDREHYLDWFHGVHIPEKLARPGYTWAAHYEHAIAGSPDLSGHVALFGGESTRVFYDPSPAQLKTRQDALTREMMACRIDGKSVIYAEEWCQDGAAGRCERGSAVDAPVIRITCIDAQADDESLEAWCAQDYFAAIGSASGWHRRAQVAGIVQLTTPWRAADLHHRGLVHGGERGGAAHAARARDGRAGA